MDVEIVSQLKKKKKKYRWRSLSKKRTEYLFIRKVRLSYEMHLRSTASSPVYDGHFNSLPPG